jgi:phosphatidylglycerol:prolipoprotein diacylglycerol transferase
MLPYYEQPVLHLGPLSIYAFGVLVVAAILVGVELAARRARSNGLNPEVVAGFATWVVIPGLVGAHVFDLLWYHPTELVRDGWLMLDVQTGLSSFGGFLGGLIGALAWRISHHEPVFPYVDSVLSVFPISWALGRLGCTLAHDHPGVLTSPHNPLAFAYPGGARWDLGFLELLFSLALSVVFVGLWRRAPPRGTYTAVACLTYAPVRFGLDFLRAEPALGGDARYALLTPGQWASIVVFVIGLGTARWMADERGRTRRASAGVSMENVSRA